MIRRFLRRWFTARPVPVAYVPVTSLPALAPVDAYATPPPPPPVITEAERMAASDAARAERALLIATQVHVNEFADAPEVCAARAADPEWVAEQAEKREAASAEFVRYRNEDSGLPLLVKGRY